LDPAGVMRRLNACSNYHFWLKRIKTALDPQNACDPFFYVEGIQAESEEKS
jgi:hypothetical protein